ncbi:MAG: fasciclin domain-containing protein, partial [Gammaproteobacteria bacterium]|nr:fasciclin domain-containing protein [Gammaproteobacteria bacterium]
MRRAIQAAALLAASLVLPLTATAGHHSQTITGIVAASGGEFDDNERDFDILLNAVIAADLAGALDNPDADLTVFAPNDRSFMRLARNLGYKGGNEGKAYDFIVAALTDLSGGDPIPLLKNILLYHV